jgi:hypothetical protein
MMFAGRGSVRRFHLTSGLCLAGLVTPAAAQQQPSNERASIRGVATNDLRGGPLSGAYIALLPSGKQVATDSGGAFRFEQVATGIRQRLVVMHAMLDTLGITLSSPEFTLRAGEIRSIDLAVPDGASLVRELCGVAATSRGPAALIGFVRDPDTGTPVDSVTISLVYDLSPVTTVRLPVVRSVRPDSTGHYAICGLPAHARGTIEMTRAGMASSTIPFVADTTSLLAIRAFGLSRSTRVAQAPDSGTPLRLLKGDATMSGRVVNKAGEPVAGAHVQMQGTAATAITRADGAFTLDSVPTGTQVIDVRKIGFALTEHTVDIVRSGTSLVTVTMMDAPMLKPVVVSVERRVKDLDAVGFTRRRARGFGFFLEGEQIDKGPEALGEALRMIPGLRVGYDATNQKEQKTIIMSSRDNNGCLTYVVDGMVWQNTAGGDIEKFVRPSEIEALEMYSTATVPGEFMVAGKGKCSVLVIWTKLKIHDAARR